MDKIVKDFLKKHGYEECMDEGQEKRVSEWLEIYKGPTKKYKIKIYNGKKYVPYNIKSLNLPSQATIIAVKPILFAVCSLIEWSIEPANNKPIIPQIAPEIARVLIVTFLTFTPIYLAVFSLSPTTDNS